MTHVPFSRQRGDELVRQLREGQGDGPALESATHDLLDEVFAGYPVEELSRLVRSTEPVAVRAGAWILSEIGARAAPVIREVALLLEHPLGYARFFAVDAVLASATSADGAAIARVVMLVADADEAVRWKVLGFLARATTGQLDAGAQGLADRRLAELTTWLARLGRDSPTSKDVLTKLEDPDRITRQFAVAAASRLGNTDLSVLEYAAVSKDAEVRSFAEDELSRFRRDSR